MLRQLEGIDIIIYEKNVTYIFGAGASFYMAQV